MHQEAVTPHQLLNEAILLLRSVATTDTIDPATPRSRSALVHRATRIVVELVDLAVCVAGPDIRVERRPARVHGDDGLTDAVVAGREDEQHAAVGRPLDRVVFSFRLT